MDIDDFVDDFRSQIMNDMSGAIYQSHLSVVENMQKKGCSSDEIIQSLKNYWSLETEKSHDIARFVKELIRDLKVVKNKG